MFTPPSQNVFLPAPFNAAHVDNKVIFDLRESSDVEVVVPWCSPVPLCAMSSAIGSWGLYMLEPMNCPPSVASFVDVAIEASMCDDAMFTGPRDSAFVPDDSPTLVLAQSGEVPQSSASGKGRENLAVAAATVGEMVTSLKQLLLLPARVTQGTLALWGCPAVSRDGNNQFVKPAFNPLMHHVRRFYAIERGAVVATFAGNGGNVDTAVCISGGTSTVGTNRWRDLIDVYETLGACPRVVLPRYAPLGGTYTTTNNAYPFGGFLSKYVPRWVVPNPSNVHQLYVSAADDFSLHQFMSTRPMCITSLDGY
jgi:hypothetical protein